VGIVPLEHRQPGLGNMDQPRMHARSPAGAAVAVGHIHNRPRLVVVSRHVWDNVLVMPVREGLHPFQQGS
jgi:hypothetical protein